MDAKWNVRLFNLISKSYAMMLPKRKINWNKLTHAIKMIKNILRKFTKITILSQLM